MNKKLDDVTEFIQNAVKEIGPKAVAIGIHNAFVHGKVFDNVYNFSESQLARLFVRLEDLIETCKDIERTKAKTDVKNG